MNTPSLHVASMRRSPVLGHRMRGESYHDMNSETDVRQPPPNSSTPLIRVGSSCSTNSYYTPGMEDRMRRKLRFMFMTPCEKWHARKRFPWKLCLQILKIVVVTVQLALFGYDRSAHITFLERNNIAFKHLYLKGWDSSYETMPYPPAVGQFALYEVPDLYNRIDYAMARYNTTQEIAIGSYNFGNLNDSKPDMKMCVAYFKEGEIKAFKQTYKFDSCMLEDCFDIRTVTNSSGEFYDIEKFLQETNRTINFDGLVNITLKFPIKTVHLKGSSANSPDCYQFDITILFDNSGLNGQVLISLLNRVYILECSKNSTLIHESDDKVSKVVVTAFDVFVIVCSAVSTLLCLRSLWKAQSLKRETVRFFRLQLGKELSVYDQLEFLNLWYVLIVVNDALTITGSAFKIAIEWRHIDSYEPCSIMLGTGNLLVWFGVLRYLGFFEKYNVLVLTMKRATPNILRFLVCAMVLYFGFTFCGWVVLGPYHVKFRSISSASECLYSLVNGDDMYVTFSVIGSNANTVVWYYSRAFLYIFISLFIYVVLSLFIAVIMDTYETIKYCYEHGFPKSDIQEFISQCTHDPREDSHLYRSDVPGCWPCCCRTVMDETEYSEYRSLVT